MHRMCNDIKKDSMDCGMWVMTAFSLEGPYQHSEEHTASIFTVDIRDDMSY
jgi:hypothetical protein